MERRKLLTRLLIAAEILGLLVVLQACVSTPIQATPQPNQDQLISEQQP